MVKSLNYLGIICIGSILLTGCNTVALASPSSSKASVAESFNSALQPLQNGDLEHTLENLDQTIRNNSDIEFVYQSYLIKSIILRSQMIASDELLDDLSNGVKIGNQGTRKYTIDELNHLSDYQKKLDQQLSGDYSQFTESTRYVLSHFSNSTSEIPKLSFKATLMDQTAEQSLVAFHDYGYPVPSPAIIYSFFQNESLISTEGMFHEFMPKQTFDLADYFYVMAIGIYNDGQEDKLNADQLVKDLLTRVMDLTKNDSTNPTRAKAQTMLDSLK